MGMTRRKYWATNSFSKSHSGQTTPTCQQGWESHQGCLEIPILSFALLTTMEQSSMLSQRNCVKLGKHRSLSYTHQRYWLLRVRTLSSTSASSVLFNSVCIAMWVAWINCHFFSLSWTQAVWVEVCKDLEAEDLLHIIWQLSKCTQSSCAHMDKTSMHTQRACYGRIRAGWEEKWAMRSGRA